MKVFKKILPFIIIILIVVIVYSFFNINGREIKNIKELDDAKIVSVVVSDKTSSKNVEYELNKKQIELLQILIEESSYTRRISNTIVGVLPDKEYRILANWDDNGQKHLHITILGGEYIQFLNQFGSHYHKINNLDFEKEIISILETC